MTDNEIIKALEEYLQKSQNIKYGARQKILVDADFLKDVLNFANRQKAEIERLKAEIRNTDNILNSLDRPLVEIKSEAIKEFWDELSKKCARTVNVSVFSGKPYVSLSVREDIAEEVVKEMVGE